MDDAGEPDAGRGGSWSIRERTAPAAPGDEGPPVDEPAPQPTMPAPSSRPSRWMWLGVGVVAVVLLGTVLGVTAGLREDTAPVTAEDCGEGTFFHVLERRCAKTGEGATAWLDSARARTTTASHPFQTDGRLGYTIQFTGRGMIQVALDKSDGESLYFKSWGAPGERATIEETVTGLRTRSDTLTLRVQFVEASGTARITAYG